MIQGFRVQILNNIFKKLKYIQCNKVILLLLQTAAEFLNSAHDTEMTPLLLVAVEQDHYCWASSSFMNMTDQPAPIL